MVIILSTLNVAYISVIDLVVFLILTGLFIFKEFEKPLSEQYDFMRSETGFFIDKIIHIAIIPFLYIFVYVLIYRILNTA